MPQGTALGGLCSLNSGTEVWWDSSPLVYDQWRAVTLAGSPGLALAVNEFWDREAPAGGLIRGCTTNPPLAWQVIEANQPYWDAWTRERARTLLDAHELMWSLYSEVVDRGAALLEPIFHASGGRFGHICGQVDPRQLHDLSAMLAQAHRLHSLRPNVMIKMPATKEGIQGLQQLSGEGISTTATLCFSVSQLVAVGEATKAGFATARARGRSLHGCRCCAALMLGRMEEAPQFRAQAVAAGVELSDADLRWAGVAVARKAYRIYRKRGYETRLLCASMRLGPLVNGVTRIYHLEQLMGGEMVLTIFPNILASFMELYADRAPVPHIEEDVPADVLSRLQRVPYFVRAYDEHAVSPEEFADLPGVQITGGAFAQSMQTIADYASARLAEVR